MLEVDKRVVGPQPLAERVAGDDLTGLFEQHREQLQGLLLKVESHARFPQLAGAQIELEDAEPDQPIRLSQGLVHGTETCGVTAPL